MKEGWLSALILLSKERKSERESYLANSLLDPVEHRIKANEVFVWRGEVERLFRLSAGAVCDLLHLTTWQQFTSRVCQDRKSVV